LFSAYGKQFFDKNPTNNFSFTLEGSDIPEDIRCVSWQKKWNYSNVLMLPDFYYTESKGYRDFFPNQVPEWSSRSDTVYWRGSTTGGYNITKENLVDVPRYKLCKIGSNLGNLADFKFYNVAQAASEEDRVEISNYLISNNLYSQFSPMEDYTKFKYFVQIDGNGNSWELIRKLRLGSCMLLVDSDWILWHNPMLRPWTHYVPIKNDLSNLAEIIDWCMKNQVYAEEIAHNGRKFALSIDYDEEMHKSIKMIVDHSRYF
jgi:hypothetical protein